MANFVQFYKSTDMNMPPLTGQAGSLITVLNQILVDGNFSGVSVTGITRSGTTATATVSATDGDRSPEATRKGRWRSEGVGRAAVGRARPVARPVRGSDHDGGSGARGRAR